MQAIQVEAQHIAQFIRNASEDALCNITGVIFDSQEDFEDYIRRNRGYQNVFRTETLVDSMGPITLSRSCSAASHIITPSSTISLNKITSPNIKTSLITQLFTSYFNSKNTKLLSSIDSLPHLKIKQKKSLRITLVPMYMQKY